MTWWERRRRVPGNTVSLSEFAAERGSRARGQAKCCSLIPPELLAEVEEFVRAGHRSWKLIRDWLTTQGVEGVSPDNIKDHFDRGHADRGDAGE